METELLEMKERVVAKFHQDCEILENLLETKAINSELAAHALEANRSLIVSLANVEMDLDVALLLASVIDTLFSGRTAIIRGIASALAVVLKDSNNNQ